MEIYRPVSGVASDLSQIRLAILDVPDKPGNAAKVFSTLADKNISVDMIIQSYGTNEGTNDIAFTVDADDASEAIEIMQALQKELSASELIIDKDIAKVSIVGAGMIDRPGIAADMFNALAESSINIKMISTSEIKISCVVDKDDAKDAVVTLHKKFELGCDDIAKVGE